MKEKTQVNQIPQKAQQLLELIHQALEDRKAMQLVVLPLAGKTDFAESMLIATASSKRHLRALSDAVMIALRSSNLYFVMEGENSDEWIVVDAVLVVVHIFSREAREKYDLESLWG